MLQALPCSKEAMNNKKTQVISIVGAGGKTSLLYTLAEMFRRGDGDLRLFGLEPMGGMPDNGKAKHGVPENGSAAPRVLVTTTTKILVPDHCGWCADFPSVKKEWEAGRYAVAGTLTEEYPPNADRLLRKLGPLPEKEFREALAAADVVLIEADGARHLPLKLPASHEPVIRPETTAVLGVAGLSCIGKTLREVCFRAELAESVPELCDLPGGKVKQEEKAGRQEGAAGQTVTAEVVAAILVSEQGTRKNAGDRPYLAVLNQCTTPERKAAGEKILRLLRENCQVNGVLTALPAPSGYRKPGYSSQHF